MIEFIDTFIKFLLVISTIKILGELKQIKKIIEKK